ncbi:ATP-binding protein [Hydrogenophaga sp.]|jgi:predicted AAA+ superfamily ATPase|uniref:ATP-binding protein n=1 Tax=Hydrogenophaga sp. TaxID=1904254 RepID=UPI002731C08E|nr:ATP-binding protein [Hydrogenophaga sp.]MDP2407229.1 ATP-binding protein [Hydrogenophaga sp.]MDP3885649.1 ATP-binding protein [Hydrogenophaga sp.]MDZ4175843.1 ATP-binding protein [Hydrogenophaga sp.]
MFIERRQLTAQLSGLLKSFRAVELVGPRQVGKTTLARQFIDVAGTNYFDLEDPVSRQRLAQPMTALADLQGLVVIDEVQHLPELPETLRVLMDRPGRMQQNGQYLLLGSAAPRVMHKSESLLGRAVTLEVSGFDISETGADEPVMQQLWLRGGFPAAFLAPDDTVSTQWRNAAIQRHVSGDLPLLGMNAPAPLMTRFWQMLAHYHGQTWNAAEPARSLGISESTVRRYLDYLTQTFMIRQLQPWHENLAKRQVKAPKIYFRDTGLLHALLGIRNLPQLLAHPLSGASWEGFALEQVLRIAQPDQAYFWATHQGAELDLLLFKDDRRIGVEFKRSDAPRLTPSMRIALEDLRLDALYVVYPGPHRYALAPKVEAVPLTALLS